LVNGRCCRRAPEQVILKGTDLDLDADGDYVYPTLLAFSPIKLDSDGCFEGELKTEGAK